MVHSMLGQLLSHVLMHLDPLSNILPAWFCSRECVSRPFQRTPCTQPWVQTIPRLLASNTLVAVPALRVANWASVPMACKPPEQTKPWTMSCWHSSHCARQLSACWCLHNVLVYRRHLAQPESFLPSPGKLLVQALHVEQNCFLPAQRSHLRTQISARCQPIFKDVVFW